MLIFRNLLKVLKSPTGLFWTVIWVLIIAIPSYLFTDKQTIVFNMWIWIYTFEIVLSFLIAILFGIFLWATIYKIKYLSLSFCLIYRSFSFLMSSLFTFSCFFFLTCLIFTIFSILMNRIESYFCTTSTFCLL